MSLSTVAARHAGQDQGLSFRQPAAIGMPAFIASDSDPVTKNEIRVRHAEPNADASLMILAPPPPDSGDDGGEIILRIER